MRALVVGAVVLAGCGPAPSPSPAPAAASSGSPCDALTSFEVVTLSSGETARTVGLAVTYQGTSHDDFDDGRFDEVAHLVIQGVMEDGTLSPSAMTWAPSALAPPRWVHFDRIDLCVRLAEADAHAARLELRRTR